jgi:autotransporter translocation and assembly factor TamB
MRLDADLNASAFTMRWTRGGWALTATLEPSTAEGATFDAGTTVELTGAPGHVSVVADGTIHTLEARRMGRATGLTGLDDPLFETNLNGHVKLSGSGRDWSSIDLSAQSELVNSVAAGGTRIPAATVTYTRRSRLNTAHVVGQLVGLNPEKVGASPALASDINGTADFTAEWRDDAADIAGTTTARGTLRATASTISGLPIDRGVVTGEWRDGAFTAESATLQNSGVTLTARGRMAITKGTSAATFEVAASDVGALEPWSGRKAHGSANGHGELSGTFDVPRVRVTFDTPSVTDSEIGTLETVNGTLDVEFPDWVLDKMRGDLQMQAAVWSNDSGPIAQTVSATTTFTTRFHASVAHVQATVREAVVRSTFSADWENEATADITALDARRGAQIWTLDSTSGLLRITSTHLSADNVQFSNGPQHIAFSGRVALADLETGGDAGDRLTMKATSIDLASLDEFLGITVGATGLVSAEGSLVGRLSDPRGHLSLSSRDVNVRGYMIATAGGTIDFADGGANSALTLTQPDGVALRVNGLAPLSYVLPAGVLDPAVPSPAWDLTLISEPIKLGILGAVMPQLTEIGGEMIIDLHVIGAAASPKFTGTVAVADGHFLVPTAGTAFSAVTADFGFGADTITVRRFVAHDKDGHSLTITGQLAVNERDLDRVDMHVEADHFLVVDNAIGTLELSSLLQLTGDAVHPKLSGNIEVASGRVEVDKLLRALQGDPLALVAETDLPAEGVTPVDVRGDAAKAAADAAARKPAAKTFNSQTFLSALSVDVQLLAPDNLILRGQNLRPSGKEGWSLGDLNVTVGSDLQATRAPGQPVSLLGDVTTVRGVYSFQGRRFEIQRGGHIRFQGEVPIDPTFDVRGVRTIEGVEARVDVRGRLSDPSLQLGSNVPLDEADVLSMIIFNRPMNQLGDTQRADLVGAAASIAGGYVTSPIAQSLGRALDLDLLEVETVTFGQNVAPRVRVGQQLSNRLFVQLSQQFGAQSLTELTAEYQLAKFLRLQASAAQGPGTRAQQSLLHRAERYGLDLLFFFNY